MLLGIVERSGRVYHVDWRTQMPGSPEPDVPLFDHCRRAALSSERSRRDDSPPPPPGANRPPDPGISANAPAYDPNLVRPVAQPTATVAVAGPSTWKILSAEAVGTAVLMIVDLGSAIIAVNVIGVYGVAFALGLALLAMAYTIGHVSGCHINPAVTLGFLLTRKITTAQAGFYWGGQFVGAFIGGLVIFIVSDAKDLDQTACSPPTGGAPSGATSASDRRSSSR